MIAFRSLTAADVPAFIALRIRQLREEGAKEKFDLTPALADYYARHLADGTFFAFLALDGEEIVGTGGVSIVEKPPYYGCPTGRIALISSMYTHPDYRRQGIARQVLGLLMRAAREAGCGVAQITASRMGVLLYRNFGFAQNDRFMQYKL